MKKVITLLLALALLALAACGAPAPEPTPTPTPEPTPDARGLEGSHVGDILSGLEAFGMTEYPIKPASDETKDSYSNTVTASATNPYGIMYDYTVNTDSDFEIVWASFGTLWLATGSNADYIAMANQYLGFCATMPYDGNDSATARQWVEDNLLSAGSQGASTTIGAAEFTLYSATQNGNVTTAWLEVKPAA